MDNEIRRLAKAIATAMEAGDNHQSADSIRELVVLLDGDIKSIPLDNGGAALYLLALLMAHLRPN